MKRKASRSLAAVCIMLSILAAILSTHAVAAEPVTISPTWVGMTTLQASLDDILSGGRADCYGFTKLSAGYTGDMTVQLQRSENKVIWNTVKSWTTSGSGSFSLDKPYFVNSGYYYRVVVTVKVYNSSEKLVESPSLVSKICYY